MAPQNYHLFDGTPIYTENNRVLKEIDESLGGARLSFRKPFFTRRPESEQIQSMIDRPDDSLEVFLRVDDEDLMSEKIGQNWATDGSFSAMETTWNENQFKVLINDPACIVLSEAYDKGWKAQLGDESIPVFQADLMFQSCLLPSGRHTLRLRYLPISYRLGLFLTVLLVMILSALSRIDPKLNRDERIEADSQANPSRSTLPVLIWNVILIVSILLGYAFKNDLWNETLMNWYML